MCRRIQEWLKLKKSSRQLTCKPIHIGNNISPLPDQYKKYNRVSQARETFDELIIMWRHVDAI
jgi:predicted  nucleic acid-binding Zn ribbon protein